MASIKTRLRVLRAEREWSQANLASQGVTRQMINSIEKGRYHPNLRLAFVAETEQSRLCRMAYLRYPAG